MDNKSRYNRIFIYFVLVFVWVLPSNSVVGQDISLDIEMSPVLKNSQVLSLTGLGIDTKGSGPELISGFLENLSDKPIEELYFKMTVKAAKLGTIIELTQKSHRPFSLDPYQTVYATNNHLALEKIPGIEESIVFDGGLTPAGDDLINSLEGSTALPKDVYTVEVSVSQNNINNVLVTASAEVGGNASSFDASEIYLKTPGDVVGAETEITNPYPQFSWEGETNTIYRLLVVQANGEDSPESLLQSAKSSRPMDEGGSLLQFENLDIMTDSDFYQFPSSGVQPLQKGELYYWQVITTVQVSRDTEERSSEIWGFTLADNEGNATEIPENQTLTEALIQLLGQDQYDRIRESGLKLEGLEIEGQNYDGPLATQQLEQILQKIRDEEIILNN